MILYCIATEVWNGIEWIAKPFYLHSSDQGEARIKFTRMHPDRNLIRIVGIAPVIGWHVLDDHGDKVLA
jgi:hypothetical protein